MLADPRTLALQLAILEKIMGSLSSDEREDILARAEYFEKRYCVFGSPVYPSLHQAVQEIIENAIDRGD